MIPLAAPTESKVRIVDPVPFGFKVKLPLDPVVMDRAPESVMVLAERDWVADEILSPLIVDEVLAEMVDDRVKRPAWVILKLVPEMSLPVPELAMARTSPEAEESDWLTLRTLPVSVPVPEMLEVT